MQQVQFYWALDADFCLHQRFIEQSAVYCGLKQYYLTHGRWPENLAALNEGIGDIQLHRYEQVEDGFRLYWLGPNGTDDGGINEPKQNKDDILLWPRNQFESDGDVEKTI